ncbi:MAG: exodeoxyribonuclease VII large subunit, partial [Candidatus Omnitrophica bacterium]|nr:exodeoxyribonuclease VII large subunit [Candidatus Omnitrophota bacterium]
MTQLKKNSSTPQASPDLFARSDTLSKNRHIYTISEITQEIKLILESSFGEVWVEGEVSNFGSKDGHFYFVLKDNLAILPALMFSRANREIKFKIENGLKAICFGKISAYGPHGKYQIIVERIEPKGIGSLQLALEQLKEKLEKEGLFRPEHKRPIPYLPSRIGVVTSLSGAAIKDILKVLDRRFADLQVIINPAQVQGDSAKEEIAQAIKDLNSFNDTLPGEGRIEVMIVGRGGGSTEDLWAFNEEVVARAIYNSQIPIISAVG